MYNIQNGRYPTADQGLKALREKPSLVPVPERYPQGGYLDGRKTIPRDAWGHDYVCLVPGRGGEPFEVISYGADGEPGGEGDNADISNWAR
jgi:general secretion pathway protein G